MRRRRPPRLGLALVIFIAGAVIDLARPCIAGAYCTGDCDGSGTVLAGTSGEWVYCSGIYYGSLPLSTCPPCDCDGDGTVSDAELVQGEQNALNGCNINECTATMATPGITPTSTSTRTPTVPMFTRTPTRSRETATAGPGITPSVAVTATVIPGECLGDCDANDSVTVNELVTGVNIVLDRAAVGRCAAFDGNQSATVSISELVQGVNNLLQGCP